MSEDTFDREFEFELDVTNVVPATGGGALLKGYYRAEIFDCYVNPDKDNLIYFRLRYPNVFERTRSVPKPDPSNSEDKTRYYWRALCESAGFSPVQLDKGQIRMGRKTFLGKTVHMFYEPKNEDAGRKYDEQQFLPPGIWESRKAAFEENGGANQTTTMVNTVASNKSLKDQLHL